MGMVLVTKYTYLRLIFNVSSIKCMISMRSLFIYKELPYVYLKWFELKIALVLFREDMSHLDEVHTPALTIMLT